MRIRSIQLLTVLALAVAACSPAADTAEPSTTTSQPTSNAPEAVLLSYDLAVGQTFTYEVDMDQSIQMTVEGDPNALGAAGEQGAPSNMDLDVTGTTTFTHSVAEGPEPGTYEITITGDMSGLEFSGTVDGEPVEDRSEVPDLAATGPIDMTVVVDDQGNVVTDESGAGDELLGAFGGLGLLEQMGPGAAGGPGQFVGPPLSEEEVTVGDTWSDTLEVPSIPGNDPITTTIDSEVVGVDELDGREVFVIDTTTSTSAIDFDLAEMLIGFLTAFAPEEATDEELAKIDAIAEELRFAFAIDPQVAEMTTLFDVGEGLARQTDISSSTHMVMDLNIPDEETGELVEMAMDMNIDQALVYRLVDSEGA